LRGGRRLIFNCGMDRPRFTHRTVKLSPPPDEAALAKALFGILSKGIHDLAGIVAALNAGGVRAPDGAAAWTEASFGAEVARLGAYPNSIGAPLGAHPSNVVPQGTSSSERMVGHGG
jgi:hypothetical protein